MDKLQKLQKQVLALMREEPVVSQQSRVSRKPLKSTYQDVTIKVLLWAQGFYPVFNAHQQHTNLDFYATVNVTCVSSGEPDGLQCAILLTSGIKDMVLYRCTRDAPSACANVFIESRVIIMHAAFHFVCTAIIWILYRREIPSKIVISFVFWSLWTSFLLVMHLIQLFNYLEDWTKSLIIAMALTCVYIVVSFVQGALQYKFLKNELCVAKGDQFLMDEEGGIGSAGGRKHAG